MNICTRAVSLGKGGCMRLPDNGFFGGWHVRVVVCRMESIHIMNHRGLWLLSDRFVSRPDRSFGSAVSPSISPPTPWSFGSARSTC